MAAETVRLLGAGSDDNLLATVFDAATKRYARLRMPAISMEYDGTGQTAAIIDSGVLSVHPDIAPRLVEAVDLTGEGVEDENGHGTVVTLLFLASVPGSRIVSIKAVNRRGEGSVRHLRQAFAEVAKRPSIRVVNLSAGVYRPACTGHCTVCRAARELSNLGVMICVAAGNLPGLTACPAKASDAVITVTAIDPKTGTLADYASPATAGGFASPVPRPRVEWTPAAPG